jgi:hypothetical protein
MTNDRSFKFLPNERILSHHLCVLCELCGKEPTSEPAAADSGSMNPTTLIGRNKPNTAAGSPVLIHLTHLNVMLLLKWFGFDLAIPESLQFTNKITISKLYFTISKMSRLIF